MRDEVVVIVITWLGSALASAVMAFTARAMGQPFTIFETTVITILFVIVLRMRSAR